MAASTLNNTSTGLEDIIVAETDLSDVDGERGQLIVRGYFIEDLVGRVTFEDACVLLWTGQLPTSSEREKWRARIGQARREAFDLLPALGNALSMPDGMDALRAALGHVRATGNDEQDTVFLAGAAAVFAAGWGRLLTGQRPIEPDPSLSQAGDYFRMLTGTTAAPPLLKRTRQLPVLRHRPRPECFDPCRSRGGLDWIGHGQCGRRWRRGIEGAIARRRSGSCPGHARRDRDARAGATVAHGSYRGRSANHGNGSSDLSRARPTCGCPGAGRDGAGTIGIGRSEARAGASCRTRS